MAKPTGNRKKEIALRLDFCLSVLLLIKFMVCFTIIYGYNEEISSFSSFLVYFTNNGWTYHWKGCMYHYNG